MLLIFPTSPSGGSGSGGKRLVGATGKRKIGASGKQEVTVTSASGCACCGGDYKQLRDCDTNALADLWASDIADGDKIKRTEDGLCYYRQAGDPTSATPGTVLGDRKSVTSCSDGKCGKCVDCTDKGTPDTIALSFSVTYCGCDTHDPLPPDQPLGTYNLPAVAPGPSTCAWRLFIPSWGTYGGVCGGAFPATSLDLSVSRSGGKWIVSAIMGGFFELFRGTSAAIANCNTPTGVPADRSDPCAPGSDAWAPGSSAFIAPG